MIATSDRLRIIMREHHLTRARVAALARVGIDTVHGWLAPPDNHKHRAVPARALRLIELELERATGSLPSCS